MPKFKKKKPLLNIVEDVKKIIRDALNPERQSRLLAEEKIEEEKEKHEERKKNEGPWTALAAAKRNIEAEEKLARQHDKEFAEEKKLPKDEHNPLDELQKKEIEALKAKHQEKRGKMQERHESERIMQESAFKEERINLAANHRVENTSLKADHHKKLQKIQSDYKTQRTTAWGLFRTNNITPLRQMQNAETNALLNKHKDELNSLKRDYDARKSAMANKHSSKIQDLKTEHEKQLSQVSDPIQRQRLLENQQTEIADANQANNSEKEAMAYHYFETRNAAEERHSLEISEQKSKHKQAMRDATRDQNAAHQQDRSNYQIQFGNQIVDNKAKKAKLLENQALDRTALKGKQSSEQETLNNIQGQQLQELERENSQELHTLEARHARERERLRNRDGSNPQLSSANDTSRATYDELRNAHSRVFIELCHPNYHFRPKCNLSSKNICSWETIAPQLCMG